MGSGRGFGRRRLILRGQNRGVAQPVTEQLVVRQWRDEDVPALQDAVLDSLNDLRPWMPWAANEPMPLAERFDLVSGWHRLWNAGDRMCGMFVGDEVVGGCGLHQRIGPGGQEIGYWVRTGCTGRGYATAAARALTDMAFTMTGVDRVEIHHDVANIASARVPAKLGYIHVGDVAHPIEAPGETGTQRVWRVLRADWPASGAIPD
jgi:ribosomal-protein-serine acetyltransferase